jgi:hypothetical protein
MQTRLRNTTAAKYLTQLGLPTSPHTMRKWRVRGCGPEAVYDAPGRAWLYEVAALEAFAQARLSQHQRGGVVDQPEWLQNPEVRAKAAQTAGDRRRAVRGGRAPAAA